MEFSECRIYRALAEEPPSRLAGRILELTAAGRDVHIRNEGTGETFLHVLVQHAHKLADPRALPAVYQLCKAGMDVNLADHVNGETPLHHLVRVEGACQVLVALMRCGADPTMKDGRGQTPENILLEERPPGWEEMLHWLNRFKPGLRKAALAPNPDVELIDRLLKSWSRVLLPGDGGLYSLAKEAERQEVDPGVVRMLREYEQQNEMVLAALAGDADTLRNMLTRNAGAFDVNTCDVSYQFYYKRYPRVPRPLVSVVWEQDNMSLMQLLLEQRPDISRSFRYHYRETENKPLFFYLAGSELQPKQEPLAVAIFKTCNLDHRNEEGRTVLFEAVAQCCPLLLFRELMRLGADISSRDGAGETVRDYAKRRGRDIYVEWIDGHVLEVVGRNETDRVAGWLLKDYNHVLDVVKADARLQHRVQEDVKLIEVRKLLQGANTMQLKIKQILKYSDQGNLQMISRTVEGSAIWRGRNKCGHTMLHRALLAGRADDFLSLAKQYPDLLRVPDNMGRTPLHYACLLYNDAAFHEQVESLGADAGATDVWGQTAERYKKSVATTYDYLRLREQVRMFEDRVHLIEINFEEKLYQAIDDGSLDAVRHLVRDNGVGAQLDRYSRVLFYCVDTDRAHIAEFLIKAGCDPRIWKDYKEKKAQPSRPDRSGPVLTSLRDRANQLGQHGLVKLISQKLDGTPGQTGEKEKGDKLNTFEEVSMYGLTVS